ncbi:M14 family metallopeptidase [Pantoea eucalypti]|jgi:hypothetical protein|uniref:M14 family metallopeptidase n=1 Tax=Pantoea eucalypti TaxID=470933 RepID=UPI003FA47CE5
MSTYTKSRAQFCRLAQQRGVDVIHIPVTLGQDGSPLHLTYTVLGDLQANTCIVIFSGVHGIEGIPGALLQETILRDFPTPKNISICLVHAVNPWGMHELRRVNETNIDLNRNFFSGLAPQRNRDYDLAREIICPSDSELPDQSQLRSQLLEWITREGLHRVQSVITSGQYHHPEGLFYGGDKATPSQMAVREVCLTLSRQFRHFLVLDIHTGLGEKGNLSIIREGGRGIGEEPVLAHAINYASQNAVSSLLQGTLAGYVDSLFPGGRAEGYVLELGTSPALEVMIAMQRENWLWQHHISSGPQYEKVCEEFREVFYPSDTRWLEQARESIYQTVEGAINILNASYPVQEVSS